VGANADASRAALDAFNQADLDAALSAMPADAEWVVAREHPASRTLRGPAEVEAYLRDWRESVNGLRLEAEESSSGATWS